MKREERLFETDPDGRWSDVHFADADPSAPVLVPTHPALASPKAWAAAAVFAAAEMGSREARLAARLARGDSVDEGRRDGCGRQRAGPQRGRERRGRHAPDVCHRGAVYFIVPS